MDLADRVGMLILGGIIGFIAGYIVRSLREIKEELDEVDQIVKEKLNKDGGFMANRFVADIMMLIALLLVLGSVVSSINASNDASESLDKQEQSTACTQQFLTKTIVALNDRTTYTANQAQSNVDLQKAQAEFLALILRRPPYSEAKRTKAAQNYLSTLQEFVEVSNKNVSTIKANPYPTPQEFQDCLQK